MIQFKQLWRKGYFYVGIATAIWLIFLFHPNIGIYDWKKELAYFDIIRIGLTHFHSLPFFWWNPQGFFDYPAIGQSAFFLGNPETFLFSPFSILLFLVDSLIFAKVLSFCMFLVGVLGIFLLRSRLKWNNDQFRLCLALFLFSPIILQHIAIGYLPWLNLFLFPWLIFFLLDKDRLKGIMSVAAVLALILLQGGLHVFVWFMLFVFVFHFARLIFKPDWKFITGIIIILILVVSLALIRITTSAQIFGGFQQKFFSGYSLSCFVKWGINPPVFFPTDMDDIEPLIESYCHGVPYWDGGVFWGFMIILVPLLTIGMIHSRFHYKKEERGQNDQVTLSIFLAAGILFIFSLGRIYEGIITFISNFVNIPALEGMEKYPFRFAIPAYYGFSVCIAHYCDDLFSMLKRWIQFARQCLSRGYQRLMKIKKKQQMIRFVNFVLVFFVVLSLLTLLLQTTFDDWIELVIQQAYIGKGYPWLTDLMSQRGNIPVDAYIHKAIQLYANLTGTFMVISILWVLLWILICFPDGIRMVLNWIIKFKLDNLPQLIEVFLVIPLAWASIMWLRVAVATPVDDYLQINFGSPQIVVDPPDTPLDLVTQPDSIIINPGEISLHKIVFEQIPFSDGRYLNVMNGSFMEGESGKLILIPEGNGLIEIKLDSNSYFPALLITCLAWVGLIIFLIFRKKIRYFGKKELVHYNKKKSLN